MMIDITIGKPARRTLPALSAAHLTLTAACFVLLLAPALWNGYPLLQYDTGGYLARWYEGYLVPSRSTAFGLFLHLGEGLHFWPNLFLQSGCAIWVISLVLRVTALAARPWHRIAIVTWLSLLTALPFLASALLTDIFAGVGVLALYLLIYHQPDLGRSERIGLFFLTAFATASHSATLAVLVVVLGFAVLCLLPSDRRRMAVLLPGGGALAAGAAMLLAANFALSGQLAWTPGGFGIAFGRMLQDGIVKRYLDDHCPDARLKLCPYRKELPTNADDFLWSYGVFNKLGRFSGLGEEMRFIVLHSLHEYPLRQVETALTATASQLGLVATGHGTHDRIWHTYRIVKRFIPGDVRAMQQARQQHGELHFDLINRLHVPIALGSMLVLLVLLANALVCRCFDAPASLAATVTVALLATAFVD